VTPPIDDGAWLREPEPGWSRWLLTIHHVGEYAEIEFYNTEGDARSAAVTALEPGVAVFVSEISVQDSMPRNRRGR
jgi:hypothetical protein